ncbi:MAG: nuclear transport factor 2 family protein [Proteobacteria bacterium]|nr:nuclear transport factor 2 family protein [Pseudomonadota bacterium]
MIGALIAKYKINHAFDALNRRDFEAFLSDWRDDCTFIYPGNLPVSGKFEGKEEIAKWFRNFLDQFPKLTFTVKNLCVDNVFDFIGTNTVAAHWDINYTNRDGKEIQNSGVTVIKIKFGKAELVTDYIFDTDEKFKAAWSVTEKSSPTVSQEIESVETVLEKNIPDTPTDDTSKLIGNTGTLVFHSSGCKYSKSKKCTAVFSTREEAIQKGYKSCGTCKP